ncbi:hypothetical protein ONE63_011357 [Megalurothrips usitatus]|uniref:MADF domain-containing protein n=1 Tax=Megalurothrips usitatus TaxID=439358 RepID=A0AAV7X0E8_9NEOP|nr:hypothetical protein ONE63_011357 [Megalurothrips usitatus]
MPINVVALCDAVRSRRPLWDPNHPQYMNARRNEALWVEVALNVGGNATEPECKARFKNMKDVQRRKRRNDKVSQERHRSGQAAGGRRRSPEEYLGGILSFLGDDDDDDDERTTSSLHRPTAARSEASSSTTLSATDDLQAEVLGNDFVVDDGAIIGNSSGQPMNRIVAVIPNSADLEDCCAAINRAVEREEQQRVLRTPPTTPPARTVTVPQGTPRMSPEWYSRVLPLLSPPRRFSA